MTLLKGAISMKFKHSNTIFLALLLSFPITSSALCTVQGVITHASVGDQVGAPSNLIYVRPFTLADFTYRFNYDNSTAEVFGALIATAYTSKARIRITGDELQCPSTGEERNAGFMTQFRFD